MLLNILILFVLSLALNAEQSNHAIRIEGANDVEITKVLNEIFKNVPSFQSGTERLWFKDRQYVKHKNQMLKADIEWPTCTLSKPLDSSAIENISASSGSSNKHEYVVTIQLKPGGFKAQTGKFDFNGKTVPVDFAMNWDSMMIELEMERHRNGGEDNISLYCKKILWIDGIKLETNGNWTDIMYPNSFKPENLFLKNQYWPFRIMNAWVEDIVSSLQNEMVEKLKKFFYYPIEEEEDFRHPDDPWQQIEFV